MAALPIIEFAALFVALPLLFAAWVRRSASRVALLSALWLPAVFCLVVLYRDETFERAALFRLPFDHPYVKVAFVRFVVLATAIAILGRVYARDAFLYLPRRVPRIFALIVVAYPLLSVVPQGIIWRVFLVHRYAPLIASPGVFFVVGAAAFAFAHVAFRNWIAIGLTFVGGALFLDTYLVTGSMLIASLEHAAYGLAVFTFGLGRYVVLRKATPATPTRSL